MGRAPRSDGNALEVHYRREGYQRVDCRNPGGLSSKLSDYFAGDLAIIETLPTATAGTLFSARSGRRYAKSLWPGDALRPTGRGARSSRAARAVGAANGANPVSIVVPCHRVIGRNGTMTGYAGGVQRKEWLLRHEGYLLL